MNLPPVSTAEGRRAWAFLVIWLGCVVFTMSAAWAQWAVYGNALYSLILGLAAHIQLLVGMGAFSFILGRRMKVKGTRDGFEYDDVGDAAQTVADAAQETADVVKEGA